jgi:hypothetical protein
MMGPAEYRDDPLRPYVLTGGRARPSRNTIGVDTLLIASSRDTVLPVTASRQARDLLRICARLLSLVEAAAHLRLPVSVVRVLASDLVDSGHLIARSGIPAAGSPSVELLKEVLSGLLAL